MGGTNSRQPAPGPASPASLLAELQGHIEPVRVRLPYRSAMLAVAFAMIVLPGVYLALIVLVAYGMWYHLTENTGAILGGHGSGISMLILLFAPLVVGGALLLFLLKPLLVGQPPTPEPQSLDPQEQETFFEFVRRIARVVGAPAPRDIHVDCRVNASAGFRHGLGSFLEHDLVLTVGLPLLSGLSSRQLAGILAHELGHFSQGGGMRMSYLIRSVNAWFYRLVYVRDSWDAKLHEIVQTSGPRTRLLAALVQGVVWLTRRALWALMWAGQAISCALSRQMEYDADQYESRLAGSDSIESTNRRMDTIRLASQAAHENLSSSWREERLCDNLPALMQANLGRVPPAALEELERERGQEKTGLFATHPCDRDRIRAALAKPAPGLIRCECAASELLADFAGLCREATRRYHREILGGAADKAKIVPTEAILHQQQEREENWKTQRRYFQGLLQATLPLPVEVPLSPGQAPTADLVARLRESRRQLASEAPAAREAIQKWVEADARRMDIAYASALRDLGVELRPGSNCANLDYPPDLDTLEQQVRRRQDAARDALTAAFPAAGDRLAAAIELLWQPEIAVKVPDSAGIHAGMPVLAQVLEAIQRVFPLIEKLRPASARLAAMLANTGGRELSDSLVSFVMGTARLMGKTLSEMCACLAATPYPFTHARGQISLADFAIPHVPLDKQVGQMGAAAESACALLLTTYNRIMGRLAVVAEMAEMAAGLMPLPEPPQAET